MGLKSSLRQVGGRVLGRAPPTGWAPNSNPTALVAGYRKAPTEVQEEDLARGYREWRSEKYWESFATRYMPDLGLAFSVSPWVTAWELIWGASPIQDLQKYKELSFKVPYIYAALMLQANLVTARGFQVKWNGPEEVRTYIEKFLRKHDINNLLKIVVYDMLRYGSAYCEVVTKFECVNCDFTSDRREAVKKHLEEESGHNLKNDYGRITYLKPIDSVYMRVRRNPWGLVLGYLQLLTVPPVTFLADEILHFRFNAMSDQFEGCYGNSILRALLFHESLIDEFEKTIGTLAYTYLKPMLIVKIGRAEPGAPPVTDDQFSSVVNAFKGRQAATDVYVRQGGLVNDVIVIQSQKLEGEWWLNYLKEQREFELGVPRIFGGGSLQGVNRATGQILLQNFTTRLTNIQENLREQLKNGLFIPLVKQGFENWRELLETYDAPEPEWNPIVEEDPIQVLSIVSGLAKIGALTYNEARVRLGFSELDEEVYGDKGKQLIELTAPAPQEGGAKGVGGFATGDQAEEANMMEKQQVLEDLRDLVDTGVVDQDTAPQLKVEASAHLNSLLKGFEKTYGEY